MIDRYRLVRELGRSPHAVTTLRIDSTTGTKCVVKSLDAGAAADLKVIEMFRREAKVLRGLDHPGIPRLIDSFEEQGDERLVLHLVQEYVEGQNLAETHARRGNLDETEVRRIALELLAILRHLHSLSPPIIHRDIKPGNVILSPDGTVHLIDFSAVRDTLRQDRDVEGRLTIVGSYGYMPFEQYEGRALPASDVYALGMTLIFLLTGREPADLERDGMRLLVPSEAAVTARFRSVLERMIEPDVERRFGSVAEVERELDREPTRPVSRGRTLALAGLAAALAATAILISVDRKPRTVESTPVATQPPARPTGTARATPRGTASQPDPKPAWPTTELTPPDPARSKLVAQGLITFAARPLAMTFKATPRFSIWSESAKGDVTPALRYQDSTVDVFDLKPGNYTIWATYFDGRRSFNGGQSLTIEEGRVVRFEFHMMQAMKVAPIEGAVRREGACEVTTVSPVVISWESLGEGTFYDYDVYANRCDGKGRATVITSGSMREDSLTLELPPNQPGMRYQVNLGARRSGTWIGNGGILFVVGGDRP